MTAIPVKVQLRLQAGLKKFQTIVTIARAKDINESDTVAPDIRVTNEEILPILENEVLKREVLEGDKVKEAKKRIEKAMRAGEKAGKSEISITQ